MVTNRGPSNYFSVLARESPAPTSPRVTADPNAVQFPSQPFLTRLSELKPLLETNETRTVVLTMEVPRGTPRGARKVVTMELQPYGNNAPGIFKLH